jgi:hypothetical protein
MPQEPPVELLELPASYQNKETNMTQAEKDAALAEIEADRKANPAAYAQDDKTFNWEDIAAGGYSAVNSALFGIPDVIVKAASSDAYKELQALRARNKTASTVGDIAGAFAPTGGLLAKGIGTAAKIGARGLEAAKLAKAAGVASKIAKGADTASDIIKGTKELKGIGGGVARGALGAAEQIAPRLVGGETDLGSAALGVGLGGAIGGVSKAVPSVLRSAGILNKGESAVKPFEEALIDKELAARGISGRDIAKTIRSTAGATGTNAVGGAINNAEDIKRAALAVLKKNDILNPDEAQAFIQGTGKKFEELSKAFDASGFKISDVKQQILDDPAVVQFIADHGDEGQKVVDSMIAKLDKKASLNAIKSDLMKEIKFSNKATDRLASDTGDVANAIKDKLDDAVLSLDPNYDSYKADWKAIQPLRYMVARDKMAINGIAKQGSDTAAKMLTTGLIGGGAGATAALKDFDPEDPSTWTPAAMKIVAGLAVGGMVNKVVPGVSNYLVGKAASALNNPKFLDAAEKAGIAISKLPIEKPAMAATKFISGKLAEEKPGEPLTLEEAAKQVDPTAEVDPEMEKAQDAQAFKFGDAYVSKLNEKMMEYWAANFADQMDFNEYVQLVAKKTNGFEPTKTASFIYRDKKDRAKFLRDLAVSQKLSGANISETFAKPAFGSSIFDAEGVAAKKKAQSDLVDSIATLVTNEGDLPSKTTLNTIQADIAAIMALPASEDEKKQILFQKLGEKYGLGYDNIKELGLV